MKEPGSKSGDKAGKNAADTKSATASADLSEHDHDAGDEQKKHAPDAQVHPGDKSKDHLAGELSKNPIGQIFDQVNHAIGSVQKAYGAATNDLINSAVHHDVGREFVDKVTPELAADYRVGKSLIESRQAQGKSDGDLSGLSPEQIRQVQVYQKLHAELPGKIPFYNQEALARQIDQGLIQKSRVSPTTNSQSVANSNASNKPSSSPSPAGQSPSLTRAAAAPGPRPVFEHKSESGQSTIQSANAKTSSFTGGAQTKESTVKSPANNAQTKENIASSAGGAAQTRETNSISTATSSQLKESNATSQDRAQRGAVSPVVEVSHTGVKSAPDIPPVKSAPDTPAIKSPSVTRSEATIKAGESKKTEVQSASAESLKLVTPSPIERVDRPGEKCYRPVEKASAYKNDRASVTDPIGQVLNDKKISANREAGSANKTGITAADRRPEQRVAKVSDSSLKQIGPSALMRERVIDKALPAYESYKTLVKQSSMPIMARLDAALPRYVLMLRAASSTSGTNGSPYQVRHESLATILRAEPQKTEVSPSASHGNTADHSANTNTAQAIEHITANHADATSDSASRPVNVADRSGALLPGADAGGAHTAAQDHVEEHTEAFSDQPQRTMAKSPGVRSGMLPNAEVTTGTDPLSAANIEGPKAVSYKIKDARQIKDLKYISGAELVFVAIVALASTARARGMESVSTQPGIGAVAKLESQKYLSESLTELRTKILERGASATLVRPHIMMALGDSLDSLADKLYRDSELCWLIAALNNDFTSQMVDDRLVVRLKVRQRVLLPVFEDIKEFAKIRKSHMVASNMITLVEDTEVNREVLKDNFAGMLGIDSLSKDPLQGNKAN